MLIDADVCWRNLAIFTSTCVRISFLILCTCMPCDTQVPPFGLTLTDSDGVDTMVAVFKFTIDFTGIKVSLDVSIKGASTRCNPLLSAVAFNSVALLAGRLRIGSLLDPFPVLLEISRGMWGDKTMLQGGDAAFSAVSIGRSVAGWCGLASGAVSVKLCNIFSASIRADVTQVMTQVVAAASQSPLTAPFPLALPQAQHGTVAGRLGDCTSVAGSFPVWAASAAQNVSCAAHEERGREPAVGLALGFPDVVVENLCSCKRGIGKCDPTSRDFEWHCQSGVQQLRLCRPS